MKTRQKVVLGLAAVLLLLGLLGETDAGQRWFAGPAKPNKTHFDADDRAMGAGLTPVVYLIAPGVLLGVVGVVDAAIYWAKKSRRNRLG
jgi:hypothetical protein